MVGSLRRNEGHGGRVPSDEEVLCRVTDVAHNSEGKHLEKEVNSVLETKLLCF